MKKILIICIAFSFIAATCSKKNHPAATVQEGIFAKGADISWVTEMEAAGKKFYDASGRETELVDLLKQYGMNTIRLRVWVNPANGWNGTADVLVKAKRARDKGMRLMIDFHYSDNWADPGKQYKPEAWEDLSFALLKDSLRQHTVEVLSALKANNITPHWVQVGNETNDGMLWPDGRASTNMKNYAELIDAGYGAVKSIFPETKVILHLSNGYDNAMYRWQLDGLKAHGARYDVVGMSLYPTPENWQMLNAQCLANMQDVISRYKKEVMVVEIGMPWDAPQQSKLFISDLIKKTMSLPDNKGLGVLYWEPQAYNWKGYSLGCFDTNGKPTEAMKGFLE